MIFFVNRRKTKTISNSRHNSPPFCEKNWFPLFDRICVKDHVLFFNATTYDEEAKFRDRGVISPHLVTLQLNFAQSVSQLSADYSSFNRVFAKMAALDSKKQKLEVLS